jgi:hypothetical protein
VQQAPLVSQDQLDLVEQQDGQEPLDLLVTLELLDHQVNQDYQEELGQQEIEVHLVQKGGLEQQVPWVLQGLLANLVVLEGQDLQGHRVQLAILAPVVQLEVLVHQVQLVQRDSLELQGLLDQQEAQDPQVPWVELELQDQVEHQEAQERLVHLVHKEPLVTQANKDQLEHRAEMAGQEQLVHKAGLEPLVQRVGMVLLDGQVNLAKMVQQVTLAFLVQLVIREGMVHLVVMVLLETLALQVQLDPLEEQVQLDQLVQQA